MWSSTNICIFVFVGSTCWSHAGIIGYQIDSTNSDYYVKINCSGVDNKNKQRNWVDAVAANKTRCAHSKVVVDMIMIHRGGQCGCQKRQKRQKRSVLSVSEFQFHFPRDAHSRLTYHETKREQNFLSTCV
jgi:hypothetical protein